VSGLANMESAGKEVLSGKEGMDSRLRGNDESQREGRMKGEGWNPGSFYQLPMSRNVQTIKDFLNRCTYI
jgi:hypothetical protein